MRTEKKNTLDLEWSNENHYSQLSS